MGSANEVLWFEKTRPDQPWAGLEIPVHANSLALFAVLVVTSVGNGENTLFWSDRWMHGLSLEEIAPTVTKIVPLRIRKKKTVAQALHDHSWVAGIRGALPMACLVEYLQLWDVLEKIVLNHTEDQHQWRFESSGQFSIKSAYRTFFIGSTSFEPWKRLWKSWAPGNYKMFLWLAIHNRCWTADRLEKRGLPHPEQCPLCD